METAVIPLQLDAVCKAFKTNRVLNGVSLALQPGEIFGLIGLNGVGKTTMIKILLNLAFADKGTASLFGVDSAEVAARRKLTYLPEKFQPSGYLTGMEYLSLTLSYFKRPLDTHAARMMAEQLDLDPAALDRKVSTYSKGMGQKLGLAGTFLADQPLLILDEPMSGLDPRARIMLKDQLLRCKAEGKTIFFSSHILSDIDEICDRIGVLSNGTLTFTGLPAEFKQRYGGESLEKTFLQAIA